MHTNGRGVSSMLEGAMMQRLISIFNSVMGISFCHCKASRQRHMGETKASCQDFPLFQVTVHLQFAFPACLGRPGRPCPTCKTLRNQLCVDTKERGPEEVKCYHRWIALFEAFYLFGHMWDRFVKGQCT